MLNPGLLREVVVIEEPHETQNATGEMVIEWRPWRRVRAAIENIGYFTTIRAQQAAGEVSHLVRVHYLDGVRGGMRIRWESRNDRLLYISSVVERGNREEHELSCEERAA